MSEIAVYDDRDTLIAGLREQLRQSQSDLAAERGKNRGAEVGAGNLRRVLSPLYQALQQVFGEMDSMGVDEYVAPSKASAIDPRKQAAWDNWKSRLGGNPARFIDALLLHGEMTQTQLRIAVGCAKGTVPGVVSTLHKAGLLNKNGGKISLKEL